MLKNLAVFPKALWLAGVARRWGAEHLHAQWASTTATMAMAASTMTGIPWSCTAHRGDIAENNLLRMKLARASFFRFISRDGLGMARSLCGGQPDGNTLVLHVALNLPGQIQLSTALRDPPVLICPGFLIERKGQKHLIEALSLLRDRGVCLRAWFAGEGEMRPMLEHLVAEKNLQAHVSFLGKVEHADLLEMYRARQVDAVVLPSLHEGIPAALFEPMAYGIPVISTRAGGIPELLEGGAGIMVPPGDARALADAIQRLLSDPAERQHLMETGRHRVEEGWAAESVVASLLEYMQEAGSQGSHLTTGAANTKQLRAPSGGRNIPADDTHLPHPRAEMQR